MTLDEQIEILQAAKEGKRIEQYDSREGYRGWTIKQGHFNFADKEYRIVKSKAKKTVSVPAYVCIKTNTVVMVEWGNVPMPFGLTGDVIRVILNGEYEVEE